MKYILLNRNNVVIDILSNIRYLKRQPSGITIACDENEGIAVIGSDANTHYPLISSDISNNPDAVKVMKVEKIPSYVKPNGYKFNYEVGQFVDRYTLEEAKIIKQEQNKLKLREYLSAHPLIWSDGKKYGITEEDQSEISLKLNQYQSAIAANLEPPALEWHAKHEVNTQWSVKQLTALFLAISEAVYPHYRRMQQYKTIIYDATSIEELDLIELNYD